MNIVPVGVEELDSITADIWASYVAAESVVIATQVNGFDPAQMEISAQVSISGTATATVVVACDANSAQDLARRMFLLEPDATPSGDEIADALGELANVVGGNVKALAPLAGELTLPMVLAHEPENELGWPSRRPECGVDVIWDGGQATLLVWTPGRPLEQPAGSPAHES